MTSTSEQPRGTITAETRLKLSLMMFLEFFIWGAWFVTMGTFLANNLSASGSQISLAYLTQSLGAIAAPFIIGLIADQFFSAQKVLGILHLAGAGLLFLASTMSTFGAFFPVILAYMIVYMPTLALVNSVSFRQMTSPEKQFPAVRVLGTIGWIVAGVTIGWLSWEQQGQLARPSGWLPWRRSSSECSASCSRRPRPAAEVTRQPFGTFSGSMRSAC